MDFSISTDSTEVKLSGKMVRDKDANKIANALKKNTITLLDLSRNQIGNGEDNPDDVEETGSFILAKAVEINTSLTSLDLSGNYLNGENANHFFEALKTNKTLTSLNLSSDEINDDIYSIDDALKENTTLTSLTLLGKEIGNSVANLIANGLKENTGLTSLSFGILKDEGAESIAEALKENKTLKKLVLTCDMSDEGAESIAEALKENKTLTSLDLLGGFIEAKGANKIAEALKENTSLTSLVLKYSHMISNPDDSFDCHDALKKNKTLTSLTLIGNQPERYKSSIIEKLSSGLKLNKNLRELVLEQNTFRSEDVKHISDALEENTGLTSLFIKNNVIGDEGAIQLAEALKTNKTLKILVLLDNQIGDIGASALAEALKTNTTLNLLDLRRNIKIKGDCLPSIKEAIESRESLGELIPQESTRQQHNRAHGFFTRLNTLYGVNVRPNLSGKELHAFASTSHASSLIQGYYQPLTIYCKGHTFETAFKSKKSKKTKSKSKKKSKKTKSKSKKTKSKSKKTKSKSKKQF